VTFAQADEDLCRQAAARLLTAASDRAPCAPVRDLIGDGGMSAGYAVQQLLTQQALASGRKIGLTSAAVQRQLGVDQPDFGVLFADMARDETQPVELVDLLQPRIEAEVAFVLGADLDQENLNLDIVRTAVDFAMPALEIVDSRIAGWDITLVDTVADNASSGLYVLGAQRRPLAGLDLPAGRPAMAAKPPASTPPC
jgi:2-keto-4-pentenoate hydratase